MPTPVWSHYPLVAAEPQGRSWLTLLGNLGRSPATVDAYGRGLDQFLRYCQAHGIDPTTATLNMSRCSSVTFVKTPTLPPSHRG